MWIVDLCFSCAVHSVVYILKKRKKRMLLITEYFTSGFFQIQFVKHDTLMLVSWSTVTIMFFWLVVCIISSNDMQCVLFIVCTGNNELYYSDFSFHAYYNLYHWDSSFQNNELYYSDSSFHAYYNLYHWDSSFQA